MDLFRDLWIAIPAAAVGVWIASALAWMLVGHHAKDWNKLPDEDRSLDTLRSLALPPGVYGFPFMHSHKECSTPAGQEKWAKGPTGLIRVWGPTNMAKNMVFTFLTFLLVSCLIGYLGSACLPRGTGFMQVFRVLGTAGVLSYCFAFLPGDIWFQNKPRATLMCMIDGVVFGLITGAVFGLLWPK